MIPGEGVLVASIQRVTGIAAHVPQKTRLPDHLGLIVGTLRESEGSTKSRDICHRSVVPDKCMLGGEPGTSVRCRVCE